MRDVAIQPLDPVDLTQRLIRCPSVTPIEGGALDLLQTELEKLGFVCHRLPFAEAGTETVDNLYARLGSESPNFCFAGHSDVVPVGDEAAWSAGPFDGEIQDGWLFGRGAADMKGAVAAFVAAASRYLAAEGCPTGSLSLLITGDEEGPSVNGTKKMLQWLAARGEKLDHCLVGEPTNPQDLGDMIKIGRRGSLTGWLTVKGVQGHTAYPHLADNPIHHLLPMLSALTAAPLDAGTEHFQPSTLQISSIDVGNSATNVIPARATAAFNIRFNDSHSGASLDRWLRKTFDKVGAAYELEVQISGESFLCLPGRLSDLIATAIEETTGRTPELSTTGGTSDARFIKDHAQVAEFGLVGQTMHQVDERIPVGDLELLTQIYHKVIQGYFK